MPLTTLTVKGHCGFDPHQGHMEEQLMIAACLPVDTSKLPKVDIPVPKSHVDDTIMKCEKCGQDIWVGPKKRALHDADGCMLACYLCAVRLIQGQEDVAMVDLDPKRSSPHRN